MNTLIKTNNGTSTRTNNGLSSLRPIFDDFFSRDLFDWAGWSTEATIPSVNIIESNDDFRVEMAAPGMKKSDFQLRLDDDTLVIESKRQEEEVSENERFTRKEFNYHSFKRSFHLPNTVESEKIKAEYKDGILKLLIPKKEEAKRKAVKTIQIS